MSFPSAKSPRQALFFRTGRRWKYLFQADPSAAEALFRIHTSGGIWFHFLLYSKEYDTGTVYDFSHRLLSPGYGPTHADKSTRLSRPEEWRVFLSVQEPGDR